MAGSCGSQQKMGLPLTHGEGLLLRRSVRTSLFKWSPDWEGAFMAYEKAGTPTPRPID